ncbi:MAG: hypothetical protein WD135_03260 [Ferruginibacter sp.]
MKIVYLATTICLLSLFGCNNNSDNKQTSQSAEVADTVKLVSITDLDARLAAADSLAILFYKDPHGTDSLRYTRYYTQYNSTDTLLLADLKTNLATATVKLEKIKNCRSEGKIWVFKNGQIFQTIYFSSKNAECSFLYIIKDGFFYYAAMPYGFAVQLKSLQKKAIEIPNYGE